MDEDITEIGENKKESIKEKISSFLFDKSYLDMITKVVIDEIHVLSILSVLVNDENKKRDSLNIENNILGEVINKNLLLRTSLKGWRSDQAVTIIKSNIDEDKGEDKGLFNRLKNVVKS